LDRKLLYGCAETLVLALLAEESSYGYQYSPTTMRFSCPMPRRRAAHASRAALRSASARRTGA
jgi:hypothetical protein